MFPPGTYKTNTNASNEVGLDEIFPRIPDFSTWNETNYGTLETIVKGTRIWEELLILSASTETRPEDIPIFSQIALGCDTCGIDLEFLEKGGESLAYKFQLNGRDYVVAYVQYADVLTGVDRLEALYALRMKGMNVGKPIFASTRSIITEFIPTLRSLSTEEELLRFIKMRNADVVKLLDITKVLEAEGLWKPWWRIDWGNTENYLPIFDENEELVSVCNIDPVAVKRDGWFKK
jgi:hypothetical protein